ncbi:MAG: response regulator transcription factor [Marinilabiliales bacterium]|nr:response regulator transcription factor [Marinilabiliales bacterium]
MTHPGETVATIADNQFLAVDSLKRLIRDELGYALAGVVPTQAALHELLRRERTDLLVLDPVTLDIADFSEIKALFDMQPAMRILILTHQVGKNEFSALTRLGIKNIALKNSDKEELMSAFRATLKGKKYFSEEIIDLYIDLNDHKPVLEETAALTGSELEIVRMIANGMTTKEIASTRVISAHTVSTHRKNIFRKAGVSNASELIIYAIKAGWIDNIEYYI